MTFLDTVSLIRPLVLVIGAIALVVILWLLARGRSRGSAGRLGARLAFYAPFAAFVLLLLGLILLRVDAEATMGVSLTYWLFIGIAQGVYVIPAMGVALLQRRSEFIAGLLRGAAIVAAVNALAWCLGLLMGRLS